MFGFGQKITQNASGSPRVTGGSPRVAEDLGTVSSPRTEIGEIDTRAPFQSVKAAVSLFGDTGASPREKPGIKKAKTPEERVLEKETHLHLAVRELDKLKEQARNAESTKTQAFVELEKAKRTLQDLTFKIEHVSESKQASIEATEAAKTQVHQLEEVKRKVSEVGCNGWKKDVESERENYKATATEIISAKQKLTELRQDFDAALEAKLSAFQEAAEAEYETKVNNGKLNELSQEVSNLRGTLNLAKLASQQAEENHTRIMAEREFQLQSHKSCKEEIEKKIQSLKEESDPEQISNLEEKLEETTEALGVLQEQLRNVQKSDMEALRTVKIELNEAKKGLQEHQEEESLLKGLVDALKLEIEMMEKDHSEIQENELKIESTVETLQAELEKSKAQLQAILTGENEPEDAFDKQKLQQLLLEIENSKREVEEMRREIITLKQQAESFQAVTKDAEEKLRDAMQEVEEAIAAEKIANDRIRNSSRSNVDDATNSKSSDKIMLSTEDFELISKKVQEYENSADIKVATAVAQIEVIKAKEREVTEKLETCLKEIEETKVQTLEALKMENMAEAAKQALEGELRKRQNDRRNECGEPSNSQEGAGW